MLHFFLSYAHGGHDDNVRVQRFFNDLSTEIRELNGDHHGAVVGFHDNGVLVVGDDWPRKLADALCQAQTLVALCSPRYFRSEFCGKEWSLFDERIRHAQPGENRSARLIPVFWIRTKVPDSLAHVHHEDASFGEAYEQDGLRELMRDGSPAYTHFVVALARRITRATGENAPLAPSDRWKDLRAVPSAFHLANAPSDSPGSGAAAATTRIPVTRTASGSTAASRRIPRQSETPPPARPILSLEVDTGSGSPERNTS